VGVESSAPTFLLSVQVGVESGEKRRKEPCSAPIFLLSVQVGVERKEEGSRAVFSASRHVPITSTLYCVLPAEEKEKGGELVLS
jgi:hypothetical protein